MYSSALKTLNEKFRRARNLNCTVKVISKLIEKIGEDSEVAFRFFSVKVYVFMVS